MKNLTAGEIMTREVLTVGEDWLIDQLADFLVNRGISGAPVVSEDGRLIGVVSLTDIARFSSLPVRDMRRTDRHELYEAGFGAELAGEELGGYHIETDSLVCVRDIMTPVVFSVPEDAGVQQVADTMIRGRIHRVFVTRGGTVVGVISTLDLLETIRDL